MHPEAHDLFAIIQQGPDNYAALCYWQHSRGKTDEETGDLYAYIEDAFDAKPIHSITKVQAVSMISACLWASESVTP